MSANPVQDEERNAWLAARRQGISASDVAPIVGLYAYGRTAYTVYCVKRGLIPDDEVPTEAMEFGKEIEQIVANKWCRKHDRMVHWLDKLRVGNEPWQLSTPDAEVIAGEYEGKPMATDEGLEIKTVGFRNKEEWGEEGTDKVPEYVLCQVSWQMFISKWNAVNVALYETGRRKLWSYKVYRDNELIASLVDRCRTFWFRHVLAERPPEIDWSTAASAYLKARFPIANYEEREATNQETLLVHNYAELSAMVKKLGREKDALGNKIKELMGDTKIIKGSDFKVNYYNVNGSSYMVTRAPGRVLKVTGAAVKKDEEEE